MSDNGAGSTLQPGDRVEINLDSVKFQVMQHLDDYFSEKSELIEGIIEERLEEFDYEERIKEIVDDALKQSLADLEDGLKKEFYRKVRNMSRDEIKNAFNTGIRKEFHNMFQSEIDSVLEQIGDTNEN